MEMLQTRFNKARSELITEKKVKSGHIDRKRNSEKKERPYTQKPKQALS